MQVKKFTHQHIFTLTFIQILFKDEEEPEEEHPVPSDKKLVPFSSAYNPKQEKERDSCRSEPRKRNEKEQDNVPSFRSTNNNFIKDNAYGMKLHSEPFMFSGSTPDNKQNVSKFFKLMTGPVPAIHDLSKSINSKGDEISIRT